MDWFGNAGLQKSNADTMTDILVNDAGAVFGALLAFWLYRHWAPDHVRREFGEIAEWATSWLARLLSRHGRAVGVVFAVVVAVIIVAGWYIDRGPVPPVAGRPVGWSDGTPRTWALANATLGSAGQVVLGDWTTDQRGACRVPVGRVWPGAEQMGLLALDPGVVYGEGGPYRVVAHALAARPPLFTGTAMDTGLVFGLRGPDDFYLLRASILHDTVSLDRFLHGRKRNLREEHLLMRGDEWHELQLDVADHAVAATVDGHRLFDATGLDEIDGGLGLWARVTAAGCFADATVAPLPT
jgi:hypothetical protein